MNHEVTIRTVLRTKRNSDSDILFLLTRIVDKQEYKYGDLLPNDCSDELLLKEIEYALQETRRYAEKDA